MAGLTAVVAPGSAARPGQGGKNPSSAAACALLEGRVLKCAGFQFTYRLPFGWVDRTSEIDAASQPGPGEAAEARKPAIEAAGRSETLLAAFERPPGAPGETINSAVVIAAESLANYRRIKTAADYFGPLGELAEQRGFTVRNEPYDFAVGRERLVRGDFSKAKDKLTMWQSSLVMISRGYIVSFTFIAGSEDEIEDLISHLSFQGGAERSPRVAKPGPKAP